MPEAGWRTLTRARAHGSPVAAARFGAGLAATPHPPEGVAPGNPTAGGLLAPLRNERGDNGSP